MNSPMRWAAAALLLASTACSFHSTATRWNGLYDADGKPVFVKTTTNVGFNLLVLLPILGNTTIESMIDETTLEIAEEGGRRVRLVQTGAENYWYGWSPFTWIITPVVTDVVLEYEPSPAEIEKARAANEEFQQRQAQRARRDNTHVIPDRRQTPDQSETLGTHTGPNGSHGG